MNASRAQGRPRRGASEVGRDRIIRRLQVVFRFEEADCSRKSLAELAGVTPALISYYFPKRETLLEEVSRPVIAAYRMELEQIVETIAPMGERLRGIAKLLVRLYTLDRNLLDIYVEVMRKPRRAINVADQSEVDRMTGLLATFFASWRGLPMPQDFDAAVLQGAIWGMCRFATKVDAQRSLDHELCPLLDRVIMLMGPEKSRGASINVLDRHAATHPSLKGGI